MVRQRLNGYLLLEVLLVIAILTGLFALLTPSIQQVQKTTETRRQMLALMLLEQNITDQLTSQLSQVGDFGCSTSKLEIEVGTSDQIPPRLKGYDLDRDADWLYGSYVGACSTFGTLKSGLVELPAVCSSIDVGDQLQASDCHSTQKVPIVSTSNDKVIALWPEPISEGELHVYSQEPFYWFVKPGKVGENAFWRRSAMHGNALELTPGVEHLRFYSLLDHNDDGIADELLNQPHKVTSDKFLGLLVEYHFRLPNCEARQSIFAYRTLRGDSWQYDNICSGIGKLVVAKNNE